ncbi:hypothetical protein [Motilibacter aurantiacus]|uniref:hypothetical protein n=1 Tax=Motilibacter aurantiacus TaxID=2714955 RepID=UPI00140ABC22|nr:hypothetical protein [Motilibacter aurantiacus]NHC45641.1 hypothetical protein [Motilibacter aurantiacus]
MNQLAWLAIPVVAVVLAIAWVAWAGRTRPPADAHDTVEGYRRFTAALDSAARAGRVEEQAGPDDQPEGGRAR